jgi:hypothetical protein
MGVHKDRYRVTYPRREQHWHRRSTRNIEAKFKISYLSIKVCSFYAHASGKRLSLCTVNNTGASVSTTTSSFIA